MTTASPMHPVTATTTQKIMVAADFGAPALIAVDAAIDLARQLGATLDIVHVTPPWPYATQLDGPPPAYLDDARCELRMLAARAVNAHVAVAVHLRAESIVVGLLAAIEELRPKLVVLGSHGRTGFPRALLGSVAESIARRSSVPVLIVPTHEREKQALAQAWSCKGCGHILVEGESTLACSRCSASPAHWDSATIGREPADAGEPAVGAAVGDGGAPIATQDPAALFATSPAGTDGATNAELTIRRF